MLSSTPGSATPSLAAPPAMRRAERSALRMAVKRFWRNGNARIGFGLIALFTLIALLAPKIAPAGYDDENLLGRLKSPSGLHWIGTDELGRDVFSRVIYGARISMTVGLAAVSGALVTGALLGIAAGYVGGRLDGLIMRMMDIMLAFPSVILAIGIVAMRGPGLNNTILAVSIVNIPVYARVARASTLACLRGERGRGPLPLPAPRRMSGRYVGAAVRRHEDPRLLAGRGRFVDDLPAAGCLHAAIVRSARAHARLVAVRLDRARVHPSVAACLAQDDLAGALRPLPSAGLPTPALEAPVSFRVRVAPGVPLAVGKVHYVGEPIAVVLAEDRAAAEDARGLIEVDYDPLPAITDVEQGLDPA